MKLLPASGEELHYSKYEDNSSFKMFLAGFLETTGASTF
jgi:hypothetical protein